MPGPKGDISEERLLEYFQLCDEKELQACSNQAERAAYLHFQCGFTRGELLILGEVTKKSWELLLKAHKEGRNYGRYGRPCSLTDENEEKVVAELQEQYKQGIPITAKGISKIV